MIKPVDNNKTATSTPGKRSFFSVASAAFLLCIATTAYSAEFQGTLNSVSITDAAGINAPPKARFTYSQSGTTITFDAMTSFDSDGTITQYNWNFGGIATAEGRTATYTHTATTPLQVTLTVTDNDDGISLFQETIGSSSSPPPSGAISDDFSTNTASYYSEVSSGTGSVNTVSGVYSATQNYAYTTWLRKSTLSSPDSYVEAVGRFGSTGKIAVALRSNAATKTGYYILLDRTGVVVKDCSNMNFSNSCQFVSQSRATRSTGVNHTLRAEMSGDTLTVYVNSGPAITTTIPSSYSNAQVGVGVYTGADSTETSITSITADTL